MSLEFEIEPEGSRETGRCECCGNFSRIVWGLAKRHRHPFAAYGVHWTLGKVPEHGANFDLIIGKWGDRASAVDRCAVSLVYRLASNGPGFMVIDAAGRDIAESELVGRALKREEVIGQPISHDVFALCDAVLAQDDRIAELLGDHVIVGENGK
jgi:hypothetical protein